MIFEAEVYIYVYKSDDNFATSDATLLSDLDLQETYRAIDSVATGRILSLSCEEAFLNGLGVIFILSESCHCLESI